MSLIPTQFKFLIHVSLLVDPLGSKNNLDSSVLSKWLIKSILWHFKINDDISILDKSVI